MALVVRNPYRGLWNIFTSPGFRAGSQNRHPGRGGAWNPRVDVARFDAGLKLRVYLPGAAPKDVDVTVKGDILTIKGSRDVERKIEKEGYEWHEHSHATFSRSVTLPDEVEVGEAHGVIKDGVLEITLPYREPREPTHVAITSAGDEETGNVTGTADTVTGPAEGEGPGGEAAE